MATTFPRTALGPLTTVFTQPSACSQFVGGGLASNWFWQRQFCGVNHYQTSNSPYYPSDDTSCYPAATVVATGLPVGDYGFYSPGLNCPADCTTACGIMSASNNVGLMTISGLPEFEFQFLLTAGETAFGCCPIGMTCSAYRDRQHCIRTVESFSTTVYSCGDVPTDRITIPTILSSAILWAPLIQINRNVNDAAVALTSQVDSSTSQPPVPPTASASRSPSAGQTLNANQALSPSPSISNASSPNSSGPYYGPSIGIGIGVGVGIGLVLILAFLIYFIRMRRSNRHPHARTEKRSNIAPGLEPGVAVESEVGVSVH